MDKSSNNEQLYEPKTIVIYEEYERQLELSSDTKKFIQQYERTLLKLQEESIKPCINHDKSEQIAVCYNGLASVYSYQGNFKLSEEFYTKALDVYPEKCDLNAATIYHNLGWMYSQFEEEEKALEFCENALVIQKKCLGDILHPDIALSYDTLGLIYYTQDDDEEALVLQNIALNMRKELYKDNPHSSLAESYSNVGLTLISLYRHEEALESFRNAANVEAQAHGENQDVAFYMTNEAYVYLELKKNYEAAQLASKACRIFNKTNVRSSFRGMAHDNLADVLKKIDLKNSKQNMIKAYRLYLHYGEKELPQARLLSSKIQAIDETLALTFKNF